MKIKAVGFDVDGTLYPNYQMFLCSVPSLIAGPRLMYHFGKVRKEIRTIVYDEELHDKQARLLAARMGISPGKARDRMEYHLYRRWERSFHCIRPFPYVRETLTALRHNGYRLGVLSDFPIGNKLHFLGLEDLFDCALSSEESGYLKPHRIPFLKLANRLEAAPEEILYVGNSYRYDIIGASAAGMRTAWLSRRRDEDGGADFIFSKYRELKHYLIEGSESIMHV